MARDPYRQHRTTADSVSGLIVGVALIGLAYTVNLAEPMAASIYLWAVDRNPSSFPGFGGFAAFTYWSNVLQPWIVLVGALFATAAWARLTHGSRGRAPAIATPTRLVFGLAFLTTISLAGAGAAMLLSARGAWPDPEAWYAGAVMGLIIYSGFGMYILGGATVIAIGFSLYLALDRIGENLVARRVLRWSILAPILSVLAMIMFGGLSFGLMGPQPWISGLAVIPMLWATVGLAGALWAARRKLIGAGIRRQLVATDA